MLIAVYWPEKINKPENVAMIWTPGSVTMFRERERECERVREGGGGVS